MYRPGVTETLPASGGRRYLDPAKLPRDTRVEEWDAPCARYVEQVAELRERHAAQSAARTAAQNADASHKRACHQAAREGKPAPKDPLPKLVEKEAEITRSIEVQEDVVCGMSDDIADLRGQVAPKLAALASEWRSEALEALELHVSAAVLQWTRLGEALWLQGWAAGRHKSSRSIPGVENLTKLERSVREMAHPRVYRSVSPGEAKKLQSGLPAVDIYGNAVEPNEIENCRVSYGKPQTRAAAAAAIGYGEQE